MFQAGGIRNALRRSEGVRATDVMVNKMPIDKHSDNTHVGDVD